MYLTSFYLYGYSEIHRSDVTPFFLDEKTELHWGGSQSHITCDEVRFEHTCYDSISPFRFYS